MFTTLTNPRKLGLNLTVKPSKTKTIDSTTNLCLNTKIRIPSSITRKIEEITKMEGNFPQRKLLMKNYYGNLSSNGENFQKRKICTYFL